MCIEALGLVRNPAPRSDIISFPMPSPLVDAYSPSSHDFCFLKRFRSLLAFGIGVGSRDKVGFCVGAAGRRLGKRTAAGWGASLDLGPLDVVFLEAALVADLIVARTHDRQPRSGPCSIDIIHSRAWQIAIPFVPMQVRN